MALLTPILLGAGMEYSRIQNESDKITGKIVDIVAQNVLNELNEEKKNIKKQVALKDSYTNQYGSKFSQAVDALGLLEISGGDPVRADELIKNYFQTNDLALIKNNVDKLDNKDFRDLFNESTILGKKTQIENKQKFVNEQFSDVPNLRKIMLEGRETGGGQIGQALFGDMLRQKDIPVAVEKLTRAAGGPIPTPRAVDTMGASRALGITPFATKSFAELEKSGDAISLREADNIRKIARDKLDFDKVTGNFRLLNRYNVEYNNAKILHEFKTGTPYLNSDDQYVLDNVILPQVVSDRGRSFGKPTGRAPTITSDDLKILEINPQTGKPFKQADIQTLIAIGRDKVNFTNMRKDLSNEQKEIINDRDRLKIITKIQSLGIRDINRPEYRF